MCIGILVKVNEFDANCEDINARESFFEMNVTEEWHRDGKYCATDVTIVPQLWSFEITHITHRNRDILRESREKNIIVLVKTKKLIADSYNIN